MVRQKSENLTPLELEIMNVLWETGAANVQTVQRQLDRDLAYTTVQTMLNILHRKGKVKRSLKDRAYFYRPAVSRTQIATFQCRVRKQNLLAAAAKPDQKTSPQPPSGGSGSPNPGRNGH